jgi:hypothetical protein
MQTCRRRTLLSLAAVLLLTAASLASRRAAPAAAATAWLSITPTYGSASQLRTFSYAGFASNETLDFTFYDPSGTQVLVGQGTIYYASSEDDGTGVFPFRASDWLSTLQGGWWSAQVVGETSGLTGTLWFHLND